MTRPLFVVAALVLALGCAGARSERANRARNADPLDDVTGEELYRRGRLLGASGDLIRAEQYFAAAIQRGFSEDEAMPALMEVCLEASRLVAALGYAEPYLARHPDQWSLRMLVASIHMGLDHLERARLELERVLRDAPDEPAQAHYFLGVLFRDELSDAERAAEHFRRYLALAPEGEHREEAAAGLSLETSAGASLPLRVEMPAAPPDPPSPAAEDADGETENEEEAD